MTDTVEAFVTQLRQDGIEAGKAAAARIVAEAEVRAQEIFARAEKQARELGESARAEAEQTRSRAASDLALAARDTLSRLRERLSSIIADILSRRSEALLRDPGFLAETVSGIVRAWLAAEQGRGSLSIQVPDGLTQAVLARLADAVAQGALARVAITEGFAQPGFGFTLAQGKVMVSVPALVEHLRDLVGPALKTIVDGAASQAGAAGT